MRVPMIEARWATYIADDLRRAGHPLGRPPEGGRPVTDRRRQPRGRIPYAAYMGLIERAALLLGEPGYGLKLGSSRDVRDSGLVGFIALNSPTLGEHWPTWSATSALPTRASTWSSNAGIGRRPALSRGRCPAARSAPSRRAGGGPVVKGARELTRRRAIPLRVEFTHGRPNARIDYEAILGCPVRFQAEWDAVIYSEESLRLPVVGADNKLLRVLEAACRRIIGRRPRKGRPRPFGARIRGGAI